MTQEDNRYNAGMACTLYRRAVQLAAPRQVLEVEVICDRDGVLQLLSVTCEPDCDCSRDRDCECLSSIVLDRDGDEVDWTYAEYLMLNGGRRMPTHDHED